LVVGAYVGTAVVGDKVGDVIFGRHSGNIGRHLGNIGRH
jgi:hypothetical protein